MPAYDALRRRAGDHDSARWCLFIDRDGVINRRILGGYVRTWEQFEFEPGALGALAALADWAPRIVVVTNQQGVGKGLMTGADLEEIHRRMCREIEEAGGRIDDVRVCPHLADDECECRKPAPGMAQDYLLAHPEIDGALSIMVGDTDSDIEMGRRLAAVTGGTTTVRIDEVEDPLADLTFPNLAAFAAAAVSATGREDYSAE